MTEVCSWPKGREKAIMLGVNEITPGRSITRGKRERVGSKQDGISAVCLGLQLISLVVRGGNEPSCLFP